MLVCVDGSSLKACGYERCLTKLATGSAIGRDRHGAQYHCVVELKRHGVGFLNQSSTQPTRVIPEIRAPSWNWRSS